MYLFYGKRNIKEEKIHKQWNIISWNMYQSWTIYSHQKQPVKDLFLGKNSSISKVFQYLKKPLLLSRLVKNTEKWCSIYSWKDGVKDGHRSGKNRPLSDFYPIMIIFLGVNNRHASESKCTYFMAREISRKRKYINNEI